MFTRRQKRLITLSCIAGAFIMMAITIAAADNSIREYYQQRDAEVENLTAVKRGDTLTVTGNLRNTGIVPITNFILRKIEVNDMVITFENTSNGTFVNWPSQAVEIHTGIRTPGPDPGNARPFSWSFSKPGYNLDSVLPTHGLDLTIEYANVDDIFLASANTTIIG